MAEVKTGAELQVDNAIDRIYNYQFTIDELEASVHEYCANNFIHSHDSDEFVDRINGVKDIITKRFVRDLKDILSMC